MQWLLPTVPCPSFLPMFSALSEKLESAFKKLRGQARISESNVSDSMQEIRMALLEADVDFKVAKDLVESVSKQAIGAEVLLKVSPGQQIVKIFHDELVKLLGSDASALNVDPPQRILMTGLNGAGKTTTSAKLANWLKKQGRRPLLLALDLYRPAAIKQLQVLGQQLNVPVFAPAEGETDPVKAAKASLVWLKEQGNGVAIFDTAGRQDLDEELLAELKRVRAVVERACRRKRWTQKIRRLVFFAQWKRSASAWEGRSRPMRACG